MSNYDYKGIAEKGYDVPIGDYLSYTWTLFRNQAGSYIGFAFIYFLISLIIRVIPIIGILSSIVMIGFEGGYYVYAKKQHKEPSFSNFFNGWEFFGHMFLYRLLLFLIYFGLAIIAILIIFPYQYIDDYSFERSFGVNFDENWYLFIIAGLVLYGPVFFFELMFLFVDPLIVQGNTSATEAMKISWNVVKKRFWHLFALMAVFFLMLIVGSAVTLGIGLLVFVPMKHILIYSLCDRIILSHTGSIENFDAFGVPVQDRNLESDEENDDYL